MAIVMTSAATQEDRKEKLEELTGGLKCRCPGYQVMNRLQTKGFNGIRYGYFSCSDPGSPVETRYPIGYPELCRCGLGSKPNKVDVRYTTDSEATWGFATCSTTGAGQAPVPPPVLTQQKVDQEEWDAPAGGANLLLWGAVTGIAAFIFFKTVRG